MPVFPSSLPPGKILDWPAIDKRQEGIPHGHASVVSTLTGHAATEDRKNTEVFEPAHKEIQRRWLVSSLLLFLAYHHPTQLLFSATYSRTQ